MTIRETTIAKLQQISLILTTPLEKVATLLLAYLGLNNF
jgi:hypothetical protein